MVSGGPRGEITKARNDWKEQSNGQSYTSRLVQLLGGNPAADLHTGIYTQKRFSNAPTAFFLAAN
jgi:hypothetical protein